MKIKNNYSLTFVADTYIVTATGAEARRSLGLTTLDADGAFIWYCMEQETDEDRLVHMLMEHFGTEDEEGMRYSLRLFIKKLFDEGIAELSPDEIKALEQ